MRVREAIETGLTALLAVCAVVATGAVVNREMRRNPSSPQASVEVKNWESYAKEGLRIGPLSAAVTIVEFSDFQCPFCRQLYQRLERIQLAHPREVAIVFRHFPIAQLHPHARAAALAAECAGQQGRFREYHSQLFDHQDSIGILTWSTIARRVGVGDTSRFSLCMASNFASKRIQADSLAAAAIGLTGTPTILVNKWRRGGAPSEAALDSMIATAKNSGR